MKKILIILGTLFVLLIGGAALAGYLYLQSDGLKTTLESKLSEQTTTPVSIGSLSPGWSGLVLRELKIPNEKPYADSFLETANFTLEVDWFSLLGEEPEIKAVRIGQPKLHLHQGAGGGMVLPLANKDPAAQPAKPLPDLVLSDFQILDALVRAVDPEGKQIFKASGLSMESRLASRAGEWSLDGSLDVSELVGGPILTVTGVRSPVSLASKVLSLPSISGASYSGTVEGQAALDTNPADPEFTFRLNADGVDMDQMMQDFGKEPGFMQGKCRMALTGKGVASAPKELSGEGNFSISPAIMPKLKAARILGSLLGLKVMEDGTFKEVRGTFTITSQKVDFSTLEVVSDNVSVVLSGSVGFDTRLDLKGDVVIEPGAAVAFGQLFGTSADRVRQETRRVPITITGPSSQPKVALEPVGAGLELGRELINRFLVPKEEAKSGSEGELEEVPDTEALLRGILGR